MKDDIRRLVRLARAQGDFARLIEAQVGATNRQVSEIAISRAGTLAAIERAGTAGLMFYASAMRRLAEIDAAKDELEGELLKLKGRLAKARAKEDILRQRAEHASRAAERRTFEEEAREGPSSHKATSKPRMVR